MLPKDEEWRAHYLPHREADRALGLLMAAACAHDGVNGLELALTGWSQPHGPSNLLPDGPLDDVPGALQDPEVLVRHLTLRSLEPIAPNRSAEKPCKVP